MRERVENYFAGFNLYTSMAHYVGKELHIRPNEILDTWGIPELLVAYGQYANEAANEAFQVWLSRHTKNHEDKKPPRYIVQFIGVDELEVENG